MSALADTTMTHTSNNGVFKNHFCKVAHLTGNLFYVLIVVHQKMGNGDWGKPLYKFTRIKRHVYKPLENVTFLMTSC